MFQSSRPDGNGYICTYLSGGYWYDVPGTTNYFSKVICEKDTHYLSGLFRAYHQQHTDVTAHPHISGHPSRKPLSINVNAMLRHHHPNSTSRPARAYDMLIMTKPNDYVNLYRTEQPVFMATGTLTIIGDFNTFISGVFMTGENTYRTSVKFGMLYWTSWSTRDMMMNFGSNDVFNYNFQSSMYARTDILKPHHYC